MKKGINCVVSARLCPECARDMEQIYLVRCDYRMDKSRCERCGKETITMAYRYMMKGEELIRRGLVDAPPC